MSVERLEKGDEINDIWILCHPQDIVVVGRSPKVKHSLANGSLSIKQHIPLESYRFQAPSFFKDTCHILYFIQIQGFLA